MASSLKYGRRSIDGLLFDRPIVEEDFDLDFANDWVVNPNNSAGITVENGKITVTKVKPKEWFIRSNYGFTTAADRNAMFNSQVFRLGGLQALWNDSVGGITVSTDHPTGDTSTNYQPVGLIISPIRTSDGLLLSHAYPWDMNIPGGYFKHVYGYAYAQSWNVYGYGYDEDRVLFNWTPGYNNFPEVGFAFWTGVAGDPNDDGYLTLTTPFTISLINYYVVNPTSIEGFYASLGNVPIYQKEITLSDTFPQHQIAFRESGNYTEQLQGLTIPILPVNGSAAALVVSDRVMKQKYEFLRFPVPADIVHVISNNIPVKYWCTQYDVAGHGGFWDAVISAFKLIPITKTAYAQCLFSKSNIKGANHRASDSDKKVTLNFAMPVDDWYIVIDHIFDYSSVDKVKINVQTGSLRTLLCAFRKTTSLTSVEFYDAQTANHHVLIGQWSGAFEGTALVDFPENLGVNNYNWYTYSGSNEYSEAVCDINYAFDGAALSRIGNYKDASGVAEADKYYTMIVAPYCMEAFRGWTGTEIRYILDMKFVSPTAGSAHRVLDAANLTTCKIKNLNKGSWSFDGVMRNNTYAGNLVNLDDDSVAYMLNNVFDLRLNTTDTDYFENEFNSLNGWTAGVGGTKHSTEYRHDNGTGSLSKTLSGSGTMKIEVFACDNVTLTITNGGNTRTINTIGLYDISLVAGACTFSVNPVDSGAQSGFGMRLTDHFKSELTSGLSAANIYLPSGVTIDSAALVTANQRGWTIYVGGSVYSA